MEPSRRTLSAAAVVLFLVMATDIAPVVQATKCYALSGNFTGWCFNDHHCNRVCLGEGKGYSGGSCETNEFKCYCIYECAKGKGKARKAGPGAEDRIGGPNKIMNE
ncbi:hypothetical protein QOZ80_4BG0355950 [Eleusine coracana subsp. coracana]|nr:hypothetical protein QOZ80_4BG0355950 [Eleusine coracana subsp. coracana]